MGTWVPVPEWAGEHKRTLEAPGDGVAGQVENRFDKCEGFAQDAFNIAQDFTKDLDRFLTKLQSEGSDSDLRPVGGPDLTPLEFENLPNLGNITDSLVKVPENDIQDPKRIAITPIKPVNIPFFNELAPTVTAKAPQHDSITPPDDPDPMETIDYPIEPNDTRPIPPAPFEHIHFPPVLDIKIEEFDEGAAPTWTWNVPENFSYTEANYASDIWSDLLAKVLNDIRNGGTGLGALIEEELYDRVLRRQETENERLYGEVENYFEARGFSLPPGAMAGRLAEAAREISRNNTTINAEITINQAELAQKNTHFMVDKGVQLEGMLREFFNQQATRSLEATRVIATIGVEIFNAKVNRFNAEVQLYQTRGSIYESRVKAGLIQADIYKAQIDACGVKVDVQKNVVALYAERVRAYEIIWKSYVTTMEAAKIKADVEKTKIENFRAQVQTYIARIEADKAKFESYNYELGGSHTEALIYSEQVKAHMAKIENAKVETEVQYKISDLDLKLNQEETEQYKAKFAGYSAEVNAVAAGNSKILDGFKAETMAYSAEVEGEGVRLAALIKQMDVFVSSARFRLDRAIAISNAALSGFKAVKDLQVVGTKGIMDVGAQLAASAMNAINANASLGLSQTQSEGETWHHGDSVSESHPYEDVAGSS